jgi:prevent-host-death family protein
MQEMPISKFKATCLSVLADVNRKRVPLRITRHGKPIADIVPPAVSPSKVWFGCLRDSTEVVGDIVGPIGAFKKWERR